MDISWPRRSGKIVTGKIEAQVEWIVAALGVDDAARFLLMFGGAELHSANRPQSRGMLTSAFGAEAAGRLAEHWPYEQPSCRMPLGNRFLARYLRSKGHSVAAIARKIRATDLTVRQLIRPDEELRGRNLGEFCEDASGKARLPSPRALLKGR